jgi:transposase-like protein
MVFISVQCPHCHSDQIFKRGKTGCGTQRYLCQNATCATGSFLLDYRYQGRLPEVKHQIIDMSLNASGVRETARVGPNIEKIRYSSVKPFFYPSA